MTKRYDSLDYNNKLIWNFRDIGHTLRKSFEGKGSQKRILIMLHENGKIAQNELTAALGIKPGSASEVLAKLESAGLIIRRPNEKDRRTTDLILTEAGQEEAQKAAEMREKRHDRMFSCFTDEEKKELLLLLEKLNSAWITQAEEDQSESKE